MSVWQIVIAGSIAVLAIKFAGYLVPPSVLNRPGPSRVADLLTVALLAALIAVQTLGDGQAVVLDARVPAVIVAGLLFWMKVPFILVVVAAAVTAAAIRALT